MEYSRLNNNINNYKDEKSILRLTNTTHHCRTHNNKTSLAIEWTKCLPTHLKHQIKRLHGLKRTFIIKLIEKE